MNKKFQIFFGIILVALMSFVSGENYPSPFVVGDSVDVAIIYGKNPGVSMLEVVSAGNLQYDLKNKVSSQVGDVLVKDSKIDSVSNHNLILIGSVGDGCSNSAFEKVLDKSCEEIIEESGISTGHFLVESIENPYAPEKIVLVIMGYQVVDVADAVSYLKTNSFDTSVGSKYIGFLNETCIEKWNCGSWEDCVDNEKTRTCVDENNCGTTNNKPKISNSCKVKSTCSDSDERDYYTKGYIDVSGKIYYDSCGYFSDPSSAASFVESDSGEFIREYYCVDTMGVYQSTVDECSYGCKDGACNEKNLSEIVGEVQLIYDDNYTSYLDLIILGNLQTWLHEKGILSEIKKNSEIDDDLDDNVVVFVYNREAVVIYGKDISSSLKLVWAGNIQTHLYEEQGSDKHLLFVCRDLVKSDKTDSDDLKNYFCKDIINPNDENPVEFSNENNILCSGCKLDNKCYPFGYRKNGTYCSDDFKFVVQNEAENFCENNFECSSNVCISRKCIDEGFIQKILTWFKRLFGSR